MSTGSGKKRSSRASRRLVVRRSSSSSSRSGWRIPVAPSPQLRRPARRRASRGGRRRGARRSGRRRRWRSHRGISQTPQDVGGGGRGRSAAAARRVALLAVATLRTDVPPTGGALLLAMPVAAPSRRRAGVRGARPILARRLVAALRTSWCAAAAAWAARALVNIAATPTRRQYCGGGGSRLEQLARDGDRDKAALCAPPPGALATAPRATCAGGALRTCDLAHRHAQAAGDRGGWRPLQLLLALLPRDRRRLADSERSARPAVEPAVVAELWAPRSTPRRPGCRLARRPAAGAAAGAACCGPRRPRRSRAWPRSRLDIY